MLMIISKASPEKEDAILASTGVFHLMALLLSILPYFTTCDRCWHFTATICSFVISITTMMTRFVNWWVRNMIRIRTNVMVKVGGIMIQQYQVR